MTKLSSTILTISLLAGEQLFFPANQKVVSHYASYNPYLEKIQDALELAPSDMIEYFLEHTSELDSVLCDIEMKETFRQQIAMLAFNNNSTQIKFKHIGVFGSHDLLFLVGAILYHDTFSAYIKQTYKSWTGLFHLYSRVVPNVLPYLFAGWKDFSFKNFLLADPRILLIVHSLNNTLFQEFFANNSELHDAMHTKIKGNPVFVKFLQVAKQDCPFADFFLQTIPLEYQFAKKNKR